MGGRVHTPRLRAGSVWLVGAGPGDPGLLTLHAYEALAQADVIFHDALVAPEILELAHPDARLTPVGKRAGRPSARQLQINQRLIVAARKGLRVVRLKSGDPFVFGRGGEEALALAAAGVFFRIVPGVTAGVAAPAYAGIPVTHRTLSRGVVFATGHGAGDGEAELPWERLGPSGETLVLYMALRRLPKIVAKLLAAGRPAEEPVALLLDATTPHASHWHTTLGEAAALGARIDHGPATLVVIGATAALARHLQPWLENTPAWADHSAAPRAAEGGMQ